MHINGTVTDSIQNMVFYLPFFVDLQLKVSSSWLEFVYYKRNLLVSLVLLYPLSWLLVVVIYFLLGFVVVICFELC